MEGNNYKIYIKLLIVAFFWGGTFLATRIASQFTTPFQGSFLRFLLASILLLVICFWKKEKLPRFTVSSLSLNLLLSISGVIAYNFFFFKALHILPASRASLLVSLNPTIILILSILFLNEKMTWTKSAGVLLSFFGAMLVISRGDIFSILSNFGSGELFALGCPVTWAIYTLINQRLSTSQSPLMTTTLASIIGTIGLFPLAQNDGLYLNTIPLKVWLCLLYLGWIGTVLGFVWYAEGIQKIGAVKTSIFNNLVPVFGVLLSVLLLGEEISWSIILGGLCVILGVGMINFGKILFQKKV